jgi:predicted nucleotidyltransferase
MWLLHALDDIFAGRTGIRVLRALNELPDGLPVSARELARRSGLSHPTVTNVLASLIDQGVVLARRAPRTDGFELNRRHALVEKLEPLFDWEGQLLREFAGFIATEIQKQAPMVSAAYLFGSAIRGQMSPASDIDLAVIVLDPADTSPADAALARVADAVRVRYGNRLDVTIESSPIDQLQRPGRPGYRFWASVAKEGITLVDKAETDEPKLGKRRTARG